MGLAGVTLEGRYKIIRPIARGAAATVYLAFDDTPTPYALKVFPKGFESRADREWKVGHTLQHRHINPVLERLTIHADGEDQPAVLLAYAPGTALSEWRRSHPHKALLVFEELLEALAYIHQNGIVHRDIKPDNLVVDNAGILRLLDFDLSGPMGERFKQPLRLGTIAYIAPEQIRGHSPTPASDVYSAGILLYWLIAGELPFMGGPEEVMKAHLSQPLPDLIPDPATKLSLNQNLLEFLGKMTAKNPSHRFSNGAAALEAFGHLVAEPQL